MSTQREAVAVVGYLSECIDELKGSTESAGSPLWKTYNGCVETVSDEALII